MSCGKCEGAETNQMVLCEECETWFHYSCISMTQSLIDRIQDYVCDQCETSTGRLTTWRSLTPSNEQRRDKSLHYHQVDDIVDHQIIRRRGLTTRRFKIKWSKYNSNFNSWEPEKNLDGCIDILQKYLKDHKLEPSTVVGLLGKSSSSGSNTRFNEKNWVSMDTIIEMYNKYKNYRIRNFDLSAEEWTTFKDTGIYFVRYERHCFVVLYLKPKNIGLIADGSNLFIKNIDTARELRKLLAIRLRSIRFNQQTKIDHCGSSAVMIALELTRAYKNSIVPKSLIVSNYWRDRIVKDMHRFESTSLKDKRLEQLPQLLVCTACKRTFRPGAWRRYTAHRLHCN